MIGRSLRSTAAGDVSINIRCAVILDDPRDAFD
jgi:hypothetical protein